MTNQTWSSKEELFPGVWVYRNVIKPEMDIINRLESSLNENDEHFCWREATVGYREKMPSYRDCVDFKIKKVDYPNKPEKQIKVDEIWQDVYDAQLPALEDYARQYNIQLNYWEAMNFIRYTPGQHFSYHSDHGWSYIAVTSMVAYINDDYVGGGLKFDKIGLEVKPQAGDLYIFPSNYLFSHAALPVESGTKYSIVTMTDYNDATHNQAWYKLHETERSIKD